MPELDPPSQPDDGGDARADERDLTPDELRTVAQEVSSLYPPPRLGTELVLLEVNPHRAHAYWNVDVEDFQAAARETGIDGPPMILRVYDVTGVDPDPQQAHSYFDLQVQGLQGHWYVDLWKDGRSYAAELGLRRPSGGLVPLARSNAVSTPPASESALYDTTALDVARAHAEELHAAVEADQPAPPPAPTPAAAPLMQPSVESRAFPVADVPDAQPAERVEALFAHAGPSAGQPGPHPMPSAAPVAPSVPDAPRHDWPSAEELSRHVPDTSGTAPELPPAPALSAEAGPAPGPTPSESASAPAAPPAPPASLPLEHYVSLSSFENGRAQVALEVNVELHIYGRAKPGTRVSFYGQPVALQPDGSFSIRKPLPHGAVVFPLLAVDPPTQG